MKKTTITVSQDTRDELMIFKVRAKAKDLDQVIREMIEKHGNKNN